MTSTSFELLEQRHLSALQATGALYRHAETGARHLHLATDEPEMGFLVGFSTVPDTDDGRAHILEHTVLCGSERYPVRDPFFAMMQRSVATFMNAMTYADRTVYPFATTDPADFHNLLDVYLDATFFPRLERTSFLQEGWRLEAREGRCVLQGVVFNEMKNGYASPHRVRYRGVMQRLFEGTTYAVDSGGDPLAIPMLQHEALREFHATHYHPSQAVFMSSGPIDPRSVQATIEARVLARLGGRAPLRVPGLAAAWPSPRQAEVAVPAGAGVSAGEQGLQLAWRFDGAARADDKLRWAAVMHLLAGHEGAPVPQAIRASGLGRPSELMGPDFSTRQVVLHLGVGGLKADQLDAAHGILLQTLQTVSREGLPAASLGGALRQLRFDERQPLPGIQRLVAAAEAGLRDESLLDAIDREPALARLALEMAEPDFLQRQVQHLLDCRNLLRVHVRPDEGHAAARDAAERALAERLAASAGPVADGALAASTPDASVDVLPRIRPADLSASPREMLALQPDVRGNVSVALPSNGLSHAEIVVDVSDFAPAEAPWLALLARLLPELGAAGRPADQALVWREARVQAFQAGLQSRLRADGSLQAEFVISASALREDQAHLAPVLAAWFHEPDLADGARIGALASADLQSRLANLPGKAADTARLAMLAPLHAVAAFESRIDGLDSLRFEADLRRQLASGEGLGHLQRQLRQVLQRVQAAPRHAVCAAMAADLGALADAVSAAVPSVAAPPAAVGPAPGPADPGGALVLLAPVQVHACAMAWRAPTREHADGPALAVAAQLLTQRFLHPAVRERGGAYGVHARYDGRGGVFSMASMADPRLTGTYADFEQALRDVQHEDLPPEAVENAIVTVIKSLDRPLLPFERLHQAWVAWRCGDSAAERERFRTGVLSCTLADVRRAVAACTGTAAPRRAAVAPAGLAPEDRPGLQPIDLMRLAADAGGPHA